MNDQFEFDADGQEIIPPEKQEHYNAPPYESSALSRNRWVTADDMATKLQKQLARAMQEKGLEHRQPDQRLVNFQYAPPPPPPAGVCPTCLGQTGVTYSVPVEHPYFGKIFPCPDCEAGRGIIQNRITRLFVDARMPGEYHKFRLHHFMPESAVQVPDEWGLYGLPESMLEGKRLGIAMAWQFVHSVNHYMTLRECYRRWCYYHEHHGYTIPKQWGAMANSGDDLPRNWLVLQGLPGTGKTALASAITNELIRRGKMALYIRVDDFIQRCVDTNKADSKERESDVVHAVQSTDVLILDDMNVAKLTEYGLKVMEMVVRYRYNHGKATLITTNNDTKAFGDEWKQRISSVVFGAAHWTPFEGEPFRDERPPLMAF